jgi:hypothetical protein
MCAQRLFASDVDAGHVHLAVEQLVKRSVSIVPNQGMRSLVATFRSVFWYSPCVSSFASAYRSGLALLSHVRAKRLDQR